MFSRNKSAIVEDPEKIEEVMASCFDLTDYMKSMDMTWEMQEKLLKQEFLWDDVKDVFIEGFQVFLEILQGANIHLPPQIHGIGHKDNAVNTSQHQAAGGIVFDLTGNCVELDLNAVSLDFTDVKWEKVKKKGPVTVSFHCDHLI
jgi:hypothetical protein